MLQNAYDRARLDSLLDGLTGLGNHRAFQEALDDLISSSRESGSPVSLLMIDVDDLKQVNDRDGHAAGDALLRGIADALSAVASAYPGSLVARLGGDEFCVVLPGHSLEDAERFARACSRQLLRELGPESSVCWGGADPGPGGMGAHELIAAVHAGRKGVPKRCRKATSPRGLRSHPLFAADEPR